MIIFSFTVLLFVQQETAEIRLVVPAAHLLVVKTSAGKIEKIRTVDLSDNHFLLIKNTYSKDKRIVFDIKYIKLNNYVLMAKLTKHRAVDDFYKDEKNRFRYLDDLHDYFFEGYDAYYKNKTLDANPWIGANKNYSRMWVAGWEYAFYYE